MFILLNKWNLNLSMKRRIPLLERDENNDESVYEDPQVETSFFQEDEQQHVRS